MAKILRVKWTVATGASNHLTPYRPVAAEQRHYDMYTDGLGTEKRAPVQREFRDENGHMIWPAFTIDEFEPLNVHLRERLNKGGA